MTAQRSGFTTARAEVRFPAVVLWLARVAGATSLGVTAACSVLIDTEPLADGCDPDAKACDGRCVSKSDPEYGCGAASCLPCVLPNSTSICDAEQRCAVASCVENFEDCDLVADNGCEVNLDTNVEHCGGCEAPACEVPGAYPACARGECAIKKCLPGYRDCNRLDEDGCETQLIAPPMVGRADAGDPDASPVCDPWATD